MASETKTMWFALRTRENAFLNREGGEPCGLCVETLLRSDRHAAAVDYPDETIVALSQSELDRLDATPPCNEEG